MTKAPMLVAPVLSFFRMRFNDWEPNPVLLRELRQAVRSRALVNMLMLMLAVLFLTSVACLVRQSFSEEENKRLGLQLCFALVAILSVASCLFVPMFVGLRLWWERRDTDFDLMFFTALAPRKIVRGKLGCGAYLTAMMFSVCLPFMMFANQLRGVDLPTVWIVGLCLYASACLATQAAICFACLPLQPLVRSVAGFLFVGLLAVANAGLIALFHQMLGGGVGGSPAFWGGFVVLMLLIIGGIQVLHSMTVTLLTLDSRPRGYFNEIIRESVS